MNSSNQKLEGQSVRRQACAIPYRRRAGQLEFCLITTSEGRWSFPKGVIEPSEYVAQAALKEAFEEAGLHGSITAESLGSYRIEKDGLIVPVTMVLMHVLRCDDDWQEADLRQRRWPPLQDAQAALDRNELCDLLRLAAARSGPG